ncbi:MAG: ABC transporter ATP-binding protein [Actinomycetota bacterium]|jgi:NitT/TauT family transport system ATP-binding protein|nr:ABC transporter ATP-binding protein [Actinomycetota bacterium]
MKTARISSQKSEDSDSSQAANISAGRTTGALQSLGDRAPNADVRLDAVSVTFMRSNGDRVTAIENVDLTVKTGELLCVIGRSGEGKTTLLNVVAGLVEPSEGRVLVGEREIHGTGADRGVIFQGDAVYPWMRVADNVGFGLRVKGVRRPERERVVDEYLELVGLSHVAKSWPRELSGGMRSRVAVASVFANDPEVLLADEPFGALDYVTRRRLQGVMLDLWQRTGKTILFVTHDVEEALLLATRIIVVGGGHVLDDRPVNLARPRDEEVLASSEAVETRRRLLSYLGLEPGAGSAVGQTNE